MSSTTNASVTARRLRCGAAFAGAAALALTLGCATKQDTGTLAGAGVGAVVGGSVTDHPLGLVGGAALGALVGGSIGAELDRRDQERAAWILENNRINQTTTWANPDTGYRYSMTPVESYYRQDGVPCREYRMLVDIDGRPESVYGTACRQPDGSWRAIE